MPAKAALMPWVADAVSHCDSLIKGDPDWRDLPVVVLSTSSSPRDLDFCYRAGANAYHVKPLPSVSVQGATP